MAKKVERYRVLKFGGLGNGAIGQASIVTAEELKALDYKAADLVGSKDVEIVADDTPEAENIATVPEQPAERTRSKDEK